MAFKKKSKSNFVRLTGLFKSTKKGSKVLMQGRILNDQFEKIAGVFEKADKLGREVFLAIFRNEDAEEGQPGYSAAIAVADEREEGKGKKSYRKSKKHVDEDEEEESEDEEEDEDDEPKKKKSSKKSKKSSDEDEEEEDDDDDI